MTIFPRYQDTLIPLPLDAPCTEPSEFAIHNTAFRDFGGLQAMFVMESAIVKAAEKMRVLPGFIQKRNLLKKGDVFPYGMANHSQQAIRCWECAEKVYGIENRIKRVTDFNAENKLRKKGLAIMPVCFGISFTSPFLNQAGALVHVYTDGSVSVSKAAVEMRQGVNMNLRQIAAEIFSIGPNRMRIESSNTGRVANMSPTAASTGADMNGHATLPACLDILGRLKAVAAGKLGADHSEKIEIRDETVCLAGKKTCLRWKALIGLAYFKRVGLSAHAHYATPNIWFGKDKEKGQPFYPISGDSWERGVLCHDGHLLRTE